MNAQSTPPGSPAGFIGAADGRVLVYRDDGLPTVLHPGDPVFVGDVLESESTGKLDLTVLGMTTLTLDGKGRTVVCEARKTDRA